MTEDLVQWDKVKGLERSKLDKLIELHQEQKAVVEEAKGHLSTISNKILTMLAIVGVKSVGVGETRVTLVPGGKTESLDKKVLYTQLLELGVKPKIVEKAFKAATTEGEKESYLLVTPPKKNEGGK